MNIFSLKECFDFTHISSLDTGIIYAMSKGISTPVNVHWCAAVLYEHTSGEIQQPNLTLLSPVSFPSVAETRTALLHSTNHQTNQMLSPTTLTLVLHLGVVALARLLQEYEPYFHDLVLRLKVSRCLMLQRLDYAHSSRCD